jgi:hypothetical protein
VRALEAQLRLGGTQNAAENMQRATATTPSLHLQNDVSMLRLVSRVETAVRPCAHMHDLQANAFASADRWVFWLHVITSDSGVRVMMYRHHRVPKTRRTKLKSSISGTFSAKSQKKPNVSMRLAGPRPARSRARSALLGSERRTNYESFVLTCDLTILSQNCPYLHIRDSKDDLTSSVTSDTTELRGGVGRGHSSYRTRN